MQLIKSFPAALAAVFMSTLVAAPVFADSYHWSGDVDDEATVHISRSRSWTDANLQGVKNERSNFRGNLPDRPVRVSLNKGEGRGRVRLVEQPSKSNNFTAVVKIKDTSPGRAHYDFTLEWTGDRHDDHHDDHHDGPGRGPGWGHKH